MTATVPILQRAELQGACVKFVWSNGYEAAFASAWLLDNAASSRMAASGQRLRSAGSLHAAGALRSVAITGDVARLAFETEAVEWTGAQLRASLADGRDAVTFWARGAEIASRTAFDYETYLVDDRVLKAALSDVARFGIARLAGAGTDLDALERTVARFGYIRQTNYGRLFDVRVAVDPDNLANTARALEPHTDNPYRDPVPTLQLLHGIRDSGEGGATVFLDGFALAEWFRAAHPEDFARLAKTSVPFVFADSGGNRYAARSPVLRTTPEGRVMGVRFNHRALGAIDLAAADAALWYESYLKFASAAAATERHHAVVLKPGDVVIFDNERILHGREAFSGGSGRLLRGCYSDRDALRASLARLDSRPAQSAAQ